MDSLIIIAGGDIYCAETFSLLGGIVAFILCWFFLPHLVRTYVLGHELTHALWGLLFGAIPKRLRVSSAGGSVELSKTNVFITLAPYFFPFYTFVVALCALVVFIFVRPLPYLPFWMFLIGLTWAFHILFTIETLAQRQPDIKAYGRIFSWVFIYLANVLIVLFCFAAFAPLTFSQLIKAILLRTGNSYALLWHVLAMGLSKLFSKG